MNSCKNWIERSTFAAPFPLSPPDLEEVVEDGVAAPPQEDADAGEVHDHAEHGQHHDGVRPHRPHHGAGGRVPSHADHRLLFCSRPEYGEGRHRLGRSSIANTAFPPLGKHGSLSILIQGWATGRGKVLLNVYYMLF